MRNELDSGGGGGGVAMILAVGIIIDDRCSFTKLKVEMLRLLGVDVAVVGLRSVVYRRYLEVNKESRWRQRPRCGG